MSKRLDIPSEKSPNFNQRIRETLMTYMGRQGDTLDRGLTLRDLVTAGLITLSGQQLPGSDAVPIKPGPAIIGSNDRTPPPTPTGFAATSGIANLFIEHDAPQYTQGGGHRRTRVYGVTRLPDDPLPTFAQAVEITQFEGQVNAYPTNPSTTWHLWIKWESNARTLSAAPAGGTNGIEVRTGEDVALLLEALTGQITEGQLFADLQGRLDGIESNATTISQEALVREGETGQLFAKYTVKIDQNGYVTGYGLASTANNGTPTSEFAVRADRFFIASPSGPGITPTAPFIVQTTPTVINGVAVPVGTYIADGYIKNGTITNAKIANAAIDNAKIANLSADKIRAGSIAVGQFIQSAGYVPNTAGWRINGAGNAEFSNAVVRGTIFSAAGQIGGNHLGANFIQSASFSQGSSGWRLRSDGNLEANDVLMRGEIKGGAFTGYAWPPAGQTGFYLGPPGLLLGNANSGQYFQVDAAGNVYAPGWQVTGGRLTINAATINGATINALDVIDTLNLRGNAVTIPVGGSGSGSVPARTMYLSQSGWVFCIVTANAIANSTGTATLNLQATIQAGGNPNPSIGPAVGVSMGSGMSGSGTAIHVAFMPAGTVTCGGISTITTGARSIGACGLFAIGVKR
jgi:hypothetical protein